MGQLTHKDLASGRWENYSLAFQMGNIGSEVSRAIKWKEKNRTDRMMECFNRALELIDLTIRDDKVKSHQKELCRAREELCDYFIGEDKFGTKPSGLIAYYDQFAMAM